MFCLLIALGRICTVDVWQCTVRSHPGCFQVNLQICTGTWFKLVKKQTELNRCVPTWCDFFHVAWTGLKVISFLMNGICDYAIQNFLCHKMQQISWCSLGTLDLLSLVGLKKDVTHKTLVFQIPPDKVF